MSKINNKKKSVGIALTGFLVLGGISQSHVYAFENKDDSSIELHKQAYLSPNYLKKQLNNCSTSLNIEKKSVKSSTTEPEEKPVKPVQKEVSTDKDGIYEAEIKTLKEKSDEISMSGTYFEKKAKYTKHNGKVYCEINVLAIDWMKNIKVFLNSKEVNPTITKTGKTKVMGMDHEGATLKFEVDKVNPELTFKMYVEPMSCDVVFRTVGKNLTFHDFKDAHTKEEKNSKDKSNNSHKEEKLNGNNCKNEIEQKNNKNKHSDSKECGTNKTKDIKQDKTNIKLKKQQSKQNNSYKNQHKYKNNFYELHVDALKENSNEPSMATQYIKSANYEIKGDKKYLILTLNRTDWMTNIKAIVDGKEITPTIVESFKNSKGEETSRIKFEIPSLESPIKLSMNVEPMGNSRVTFRVVPNKSSLKPINNLNSITNAPAKKTNLDPNSKKKELEPIEETIINSGKEESNNKKNSLPKTGLPINTGILATLGTILSGLGISLKKFKK